MISRRAALMSLGFATPSLIGAGATAKPLAPGEALSADDFRVPNGYLNAAYMHPMTILAAKALGEHAERRLSPGGGWYAGPSAKKLFAQLINAPVSSVAYIPSTTYGENFVAASLGLKAGRGRVVTDALHFDGSLLLYQGLAAKGVDLEILPMAADGAISMDRLEAALQRPTDLVSISLVSWINGFQHDLKTVCDLAHRKGALVYVDVAQAAGAVPIDVEATGVDFLACSTFKWLMGDFGLGFLYVREGVARARLQRTEFGYQQIEDFKTHFLPGDPPGSRPFVITPAGPSASGLFEISAGAKAAEAAAAASIGQILKVGVKAIQTRRQPLIDRLRDRLSPRYKPLTPTGTRSSIISFALVDADKRLDPRLKEAGLKISTYENRFRVSPSVYNSLEEIDRLCDVLLA